MSRIGASVETENGLVVAQVLGMVDGGPEVNGKLGLMEFLPGAMKMC